MLNIKAQMISMRSLIRSGAQPGMKLNMLIYMGKAAYFNLYVNIFHIFKRKFKINRKNQFEKNLRASINCLEMISDGS